MNRFSISFNNKLELKRILFWLYAKGGTWNAGGQEYEPSHSSGCGFLITAL